MKKILFASAECAPFVKTGGLGAVVGSLPKQLNHKKYDVRVVLPDYHCIDAKWREQMETLVTFPDVFRMENADSYCEDIKI